MAVADDVIDVGPRRIDRFIVTQLATGAEVSTRVRLLGGVFLCAAAIMLTLLVVQSMQLLAMSNKIDLLSYRVAELEKSLEHRDRLR